MLFLVGTAISRSNAVLANQPVYRLRLVSATPLLNPRGIERYTSNPSLSTRRAAELRKAANCHPSSWPLPKKLSDWVTCSLLILLRGAWMGAASQNEMIFGLLEAFEGTLCGCPSLW